MKNKDYWENIYETKNPDEVSWTQEIPEISLKLIDELHLLKSAQIIDVGGGDSNLVDHLLSAGYENITVLDISEKAIDRAKVRLGTLSEKVTWIVADVTEFEPKLAYDLWHDRATFHFLTGDNQIRKYKYLTEKYISRFMILAGFSNNGPLKCSGLDVKQHSIEDLLFEFSENFVVLNSFYANHQTPFGTSQDFVYACFKKSNLYVSML